MTTADMSCFDDDALRHARVRLGARMRSARTLEECARAVCDVLHEELRTDGRAGEARACALVRCFKTHALGGLDPPLRQYARSLPGVGAAAPDDLPCLVLLA